MEHSSAYHTNAIPSNAMQMTTHIHDLHLKPGARGWEEQVAPGYRFLFDVVREACGAFYFVIELLRKVGATYNA